MYFKVYEFKEDFEVSKLNNSVVDHCSKYTDPNMRKMSLFAYYKMLELVFESYKMNLYDREISFEGKPHFTDYKMYFNISHEDNLVAIAISDDHEVGIDLARMVTNLDLAKKILSKDEYSDFEKAIDKEDYIARKWAMKEAYSKKTGEGLSDAIFRTTINTKISKVTYYDKQYYLCISE